MSQQTDFATELARKWCLVHSKSTEDDPCKRFCACRAIAAGIREALEEAQKAAKVGIGPESNALAPTIAKALEIYARLAALRGR